MSNQVRLLTTLVVCTSLVDAITIPGYEPNDFLKEDKLGIQVGAIKSDKTNLNYPYYAMDMCKGHDGETDHESMWADKGISPVTGDHMNASPYMFQFNHHKQCIPICKKTYQSLDVSRLQFYTQHDYTYQLYIDGLPSAHMVKDASGNEIVDYVQGIPIGKYFKGGKVLLYNHLDMIVEVHDTYDGHQRIVGFDVLARSITEDEKRFTCKGGDDPNEGLMLQSHEPTDISFTYSVTIVKSKLTWAHRLDHYVKIGDSKVHWSQIFVTFSILTIFSLMMMGVLKSTLSKDFAMLEMGQLARQRRREQRKKDRYDQLNQSDDTQSLNNRNAKEKIEEAAWKKLQGDVFRPPKYPAVMACLIGTGVQIFFMVYVTLFAMLVGVISPFLRTGCMIVLFTTYSGSGYIGGLLTARFYRMFNGTDWLFSASMSAIIYPGFVVAMIVFTDLVDVFEKSYTGFPFSTVSLIGLGYVFVTIPIAYMGAYKGFIMKPLPLPTKTSRVARDVPPQPINRDIKVLMAFFGGIIFTSVYFEFLYIMKSVWHNQIYFMYGWLFFDLFMMSMIVCLVGMLNTYRDLTCLNHRWWWRSFLIGSSAGLYMTAFALYFLFTDLSYNMLGSYLIYAAQMAIVLVSFSIMCGSMALTSSFLFCTQIYSTARVD